MKAGSTKGANNANMVDWSMKLGESFEGPVATIDIDDGAVTDQYAVNVHHAPAIIDALSAALEETAKKRTAPQKKPFTLDVQMPWEGGPFEGWSIVEMKHTLTEGFQKQLYVKMVSADGRYIEEANGNEFYVFASLANLASQSKPDCRCAGPDFDEDTPCPVQGHMDHKSGAHR